MKSCDSAKSCANSNLISQYEERFGFDACNERFGLECCSQTIMMLTKTKNKKLSIETLHKLALNDPNDIGEWQFVDPNQWNDRYEGCRGAKQSPINIATTSTVYNDRLGDFIFRNYDMPLRWNITFDGFSGSYLLFFLNKFIRL